MDQVESKPCPFCGDEDTCLTDLSGIEHEVYVVGCVNCEAWGPEATSADDAWRFWNQRAI